MGCNRSFLSMTDGAPKAPLRQREALPDCGAKRRPVRPPEILISRNPNQHKTGKHQPTKTRTYHARHQVPLGSTATTRRVQESLKIQLGTFQGPSVCICDPLDCKMVPKWCPRTSKWIQNGHLGTLKGVKNQHNPIIQHIAN